MNTKLKNVSPWVVELLHLKGVRKNTTFSSHISSFSSIFILFLIVSIIPTKHMEVHFTLLPKFLSYLFLSVLQICSLELVFVHEFRFGACRAFTGRLHSAICHTQTPPKIKWQTSSTYIAVFCLLIALENVNFSSVPFCKLFTSLSSFLVTPLTLMNLILPFLLHNKPKVEKFKLKCLFKKNLLSLGWYFPWWNKMKQK